MKNNTFTSFINSSIALFLHHFVNITYTQCSANEHLLVYLPVFLPESCFIICKLEISSKSCHSVLMIVKVLYSHTINTSVFHNSCFKSRVPYIVPRCYFQQRRSFPVTQMLMSTFCPRIFFCLEYPVGRSFYIWNELFIISSFHVITHIIIVDGAIFLGKLAYPSQAFSS